VNLPNSKMNYLISIFNFILLLAFVTSFVQFEDNKEYEFLFKSKFDLTPALLGGQLGNATLLVRKFGNSDRNLAIRIKDSHFSGTNVNEESKTNIEGVFGLKRDTTGKITHIISRSTAAKEILTKKSIVGMLADDFTFFHDYLKNPTTQHQIKQSIGMCDSTISAVRDPVKNLAKILAQAQHAKCEVEQLTLKGGQYLLNGSTKQLGTIKPDSNVGMSVIINTKTNQIKEVAKFTFLNLVVGIELQARHNMILTYVREHDISSETTLEKPYYPFSNEDIDTFITNL